MVISAAPCWPQVLQGQDVKKYQEGASLTGIRGPGLQTAEKTAEPAMVANGDGNLSECIMAIKRARINNELCEGLFNNVFLTQYQLHAY